MGWRRAAITKTLLRTFSEEVDQLEIEVKNLQTTYINRYRRSKL